MLSFIIILFILYIFLSKRENYSLNDPFIEGMKDRFISPTNHRYINQIEYWKDAPNINLEGVFSKPSLTSDQIDWSKVNDYEYPKIVGYLQGRNDATKIKSINAN